MGAFQDNAISQCQLLPEGPVGLNLTWNLFDSTWSSTHECVFK